MPVIPDAQASVVIQHEAVGIAEAHNSSRGRTLARQLIATPHLVTHLFVELAPGQYGGQINAATQARAQGRAQVRMNLNFMQNFTCDVRLEEVVADAIMAGVPVHCADLAVGGTRMGGRPANMTLRNQNAAAIFTAITGTGDPTNALAAGSLILFGGAHFDVGNNTIPNLLPNLSWVRAG
jgi:hypothetical protein